MDDIIPNILLGLIGLLILMLIVTGLVYGPTSLAVDKQCLEAGYPKSTVSWDLEGYCLNLDGSVRGKVTKLGEK